MTEIKSQDIFVKSNPLPDSESLDCEAQGLEELRKALANTQIQIPKILRQDNQELHLERIENQTPTDENWVALAEGLAGLHDQPLKNGFGFHRDNYIGLSPQPNTWKDNWGLFFFEQRLHFQIQRVKEESLRSSWLVTLNRSKDWIINKLNEHQPKSSLVHGDLWSGNVLFSENGPWLIDPAIYYADREVDLAMSKLFGGFPKVFYSTYSKLHPLPEGWKERETVELNGWEVSCDGMEINL